MATARPSANLVIETFRSSFTVFESAERWVNEGDAFSALAASVNLTRCLMWFARALSLSHSNVFILKH